MNYYNRLKFGQQTIVGIIEKFFKIGSKIGQEHILHNSKLKTYIHIEGISDLVQF